MFNSAGVSDEVVISGEEQSHINILSDEIFYMLEGNAETQNSLVGHLSNE